MFGIHKNTLSLTAWYVYKNQNTPPVEPDFGYQTPKYICNGGIFLKLVSSFLNHYKTRPHWWRVPNEDVFCSGRNLTALTINMSPSHHVKRLQSEHDEPLALSLKYTFLFNFFYFFFYYFFSRCELLSIINRGTQIRSDAT